MGSTTRLGKSHGANAPVTESGASNATHPMSGRVIAAPTKSTKNATAVWSAIELAAIGA